MGPGVAEATAGGWTIEHPRAPTGPAVWIALMGPDNSELAGPWQLSSWPRQTTMSGWAEDFRVLHVASDTTVIELADGPWSCTGHEFRDEGLLLDLTLVHIESGRSINGTFDLEDGVWAPGDGGGQLTVAEFHRAYAAVNTPAPVWPADPFKEVRGPGVADVATRDGQYLIDLTTNRWRMSGWICPPRILHIPTGDCLLDLKTTYWNGRALVRPDGRVELRLTQYPAGPGLLLELDLPGERYRLAEGSLDGLRGEGALEEVQAALGRSAADLEELGILLDVRSSRRPAAGPVVARAWMTAPREPGARAASATAPATTGPANTKAVEVERRPVSVSAAWMEDPDFNPRPAHEPCPLPMARPAAVRERSAEPEAVGGPELPDPARITAEDIRDLADAIAAEVARRGLQGKLQYEMIVIGVLRAAAAGITRAADAVAILETLAQRRGDTGR